MDAGHDLDQARVLNHMMGLGEITLTLSRFYPTLAYRSMVTCMIFSPRIPLVSVQSLGSSLPIDQYI